MNSTPATITHVWYGIPHCVNLDRCRRRQLELVERGDYDNGIILAGVARRAGVSTMTVWRFLMGVHVRYGTARAIVERGLRLGWDDVVELAPD